MVTLGGLGVAKSSHIGENLTVGFVGFDYNNGYIETRRIVPDKDIDAIITGESYIGEENNRFGAVYAKKFFGDLTGTVVGSVSGRAGSANRLANPSTFNFTGDIQLTQEVIFVGQGERIEFPTTLSNAFISNKDEVIDVQTDDELLVNRVRNDIGAKKMQIATLLDAVPVMPVGSVVPYAGVEAPDGWLFCDGSEYSQSIYDKLYESIGQTYAGLGSSVGFFKVPDMRGRFALGAQGMGPNASAANRVTGDNKLAADTLGATGGTESKFVLEENLPDHQHDLYYANTQFYALAEKQFNIVDDQVDDYHFYLQTSGQLSGVGLKNTQGVKSDNAIAQAMDVMNPFQTMNYIIYAGKIV
jgi:microcystin-dependent protein